MQERPPDVVAWEIRPYFEPRGDAPDEDELIAIVKRGTVLRSLRATDWP